MSSRREFLNRMLVSTGGLFILLKSDALAKVASALENIPPNATPLEVAGDEKFWASIQSAFEIDRSIINFNNGGVCPTPFKVHHAFKEYLDYSNQSPSYMMWRHLEPNKELVRTKLARVFGCDKEEIAITRNASEALENVQFGMDLEKGDEVLTTTQDYPRMIATWEQSVRRFGIRVVKVSYPAPLKNQDDIVKALRNGITNKTKVILVSHVVFLNGQILPILEISRMAHENGLKVICDGAHSFCHFPFKHKDLECDYFGTSLHKWTFAPVGTGFLYVRKELIPKIWPLMAAPEEMDNNIRKFEEIGTHPAANHNAIAEALAFNEGIGLERKAARLRFLHKRWIDKLSKYDNVKFVTNIENESHWCGIVNVNIEGTDVSKLVNYFLDKHRIYVIPIIHQEFKGIRVSPNVYTLLSEIDYFADVMESVAKGEVAEVMEVNEK
ncbi:aminotransferase class V-fold PLP-dependent enzyme [Bacteroidota bacterium]